LGNIECRLEGFWTIV